MNILRNALLKNKHLNDEKESPTNKFNTSEDFYKNSQQWTYEIYQSQSVWLKRVMAALICMCICLALSLLTNVFLFPLKQKVPYLYSFDNATGQVTKIGELEPSTLTSNWEMTRYFITHYVVNRESYDFDNIDYPYQVAWAMSDGDVRKQYDLEVQSTVATSPYKLYGKDKFITVRVTSINRLSDDTADVRFEKTLHDKGAGTSQTSQEESIVKWNYEKQKEVTQKMLDRDPLGFKVKYYQRTQVNV